MSMQPPLVVIVGAAQAVIGLLQSNWTGSPSVNEITWVSSKFETAQDVPPNAQLVIACYNPAGPVQSEQLSKEVYQFLEDVVIDIYVQNSAGTATTMTYRETMKNQVYSILHSNQFNIPNFTGDVFPIREREKVESPQLWRLSIIVRCRSFQMC
jgi:hypothetical protein